MTCSVGPAPHSCPSTLSLAPADDQHRETVNVCSVLTAPNIRGGRACAVRPAMPPLFTQVESSASQTGYSYRASTAAPPTLALSHRTTINAPRGEALLSSARSRRALATLPRIPEMEKMEFMLDAVRSHLEDVDTSVLSDLTWQLVSLCTSLSKNSAAEAHGWTPGTSQLPRSQKPNKHLLPLREGAGVDGPETEPAAANTHELNPHTSIALGHRPDDTSWTGSLGRAFSGLR